MHENIHELILMLLREGSTHHALELYREETGATREESRYFVETLAAQNGLRQPSRSLLASLFGGLSRI